MKWATYRRVGRCQWAKRHIFFAADISEAIDSAITIIGRNVPLGIYYGPRTSNSFQWSLELVR